MTTALPSIADIATKPGTHGGVRGGVGAMRNYLADLMGTDGATATANATLKTFAANYAAISAAPTMTVADRGKFCACTGTWTFALIAAATAGSGFSLLIKNEGAGVITLDPNASELINGVTTLALAPGQAALVICTGSAWKAQLTNDNAVDLASTQSINGPKTFADTAFLLADNADASRKGRFEMGGVASATTRVWSMPDSSGSLAIHAFFVSRAAALAWMATETMPDGTLVSVDGLLFEKYAGVGVISDMPNYVPAADTYPEHFAENTVPGTTDMSSALQLAVNYVSSLGGGSVRLWSSVYVAAGISVPNNCYIVGVGMDVSILRLKAGTNTYLVGSSQWVANGTTCNLLGGLRDLTCDGNVAANPTGSCVWFTAWRASFIRVRFTNSGGSGLVLSAVMRNNTTLLTNHMAENQVIDCNFDLNTNRGIYGKDGAASMLADGEIRGCHFNGNGEHAIFIERSTGWKIQDNQIYDSGKSGIYLQKFARTIVTGNHIELKADALAAAGRAACIYLETFSSQGAWHIDNNALVIGTAADTTTKNLHGLAILGSTSDSGAVGANAFSDTSSGQLGTALYLSATALTGLTNVHRSRTNLPWKAITSVTSGVLACTRYDAIALNISGGATITDITSDNPLMAEITIVNENATAVTFTHNTAKIRCLGAASKTLAQYEAITFRLRSTGVWQQIGGKQ